MVTLENTNKSIKLYWCGCKSPSPVRNFGDELSPLIVSSLFHCDIQPTHPHECELTGIGSILSWVEKVENSVHVWGSGYIRKGETKFPSPLICHAVRGELSANRIDRTQLKALGDPGILASRIFPAALGGAGKIGIVPHLHDLNDQSLDAFRNNGNYIIISPLQAPEKVVEQITSCEIIFSSGLHGLIIADSFGIPNIRIRISNKVEGGDYKFMDYCSGVEKQYGCITLSEIESITTAVKMETKWQPITRLHERQNQLISAFPNELLRS